MPELPEVETIRRSLKFLAGRQIDSLTLSSLAPVETTTPASIRRAFIASTLSQLERRGKYLLLRNLQGTALVIHLGMSGQLRFFPPGHVPRDPHTHMEMKFSDGSILLYIDPRRFGTLSLSCNPKGTDNPFLARLGPDYDDPHLTEEEFIHRCRRHGGLSLKSLTLHQGVAAGLGNIYACEALYRSGLSPRRRVKRTQDAKLVALLQAAREAIGLGVQHGGSSLRDYFDGLGNRGVMKDFLLVYDREGEMSLDGRGLVKRIVQNGRSTWYCPTVQK
jgi:formamidopyrimidine-DNA glycosylase